MRTAKLSNTGPQCSQVGYGTSGISGHYGPVDRAQAIASLEAALDAGVTLIDGGDFYGAGAAELLIAEALRERRREDVILSIKYGGLRDPRGGWLGHDVSPKATKSAITYSLTRLGTDYIDIYRPARFEPDIPVEETIGAIGELIDQGYVRHVALSEVGPETLRRAHAVRPIVDVQLEYSLLYRGIEDAMLPTCRELGIAVTAYGILSRGLLSGRLSTDQRFERGDGRAGAPRFEPENLRHNLELVERLRSIADARGATLTQLAIAWVISRGEDIVPLVGSRRPEQVQEALGALSIELTADELAEIELAIPRGAVAGARYPARVMAQLDRALG